MTMKKLLAATCASALALSLAVPAFAVDTFEGQKTDFTTAMADTSMGSVTVSVPATATLYVNPYGALIQLKDNEEDFGTGTKEVDISQGSISDTLFSQTQLVKNTGDTDLDLKVVVKSTDAAAAAGKTNLGKFVAMNADGSTGFTAAGTALDNAPEMMGFFEIKDATATAGKVGAITWTAFDDYATGANSGMSPILDATASATAAPTTVIYTLDAAGTDTVDDGFGGTTTVSVPSYAAFHLVGKVNPNVTATVWGDAATALPSVSVIFAFTPHVGP